MVGVSHARPEEMLIGALQRMCDDLTDAER